jgi:carbonic anhydrase
MVKEDIEFLRSSPLILKNTQIIGVTYDIETGLLKDVEESD